MTGTKPLQIHQSVLRKWGEPRRYVNKRRSGGPYPRHITHLIALNFCFFVGISLAVHLCYGGNKIVEESEALVRCRREVVDWVGSNIVPHERELRAWLRCRAMSAHDIDDIVHDAYLCIAQLTDVVHIRSGRAYLFTTARSVMLQRVRRDRIVPIESLTEIEAMTLQDANPGPERQASARQELARIQRLVASLPDRCREIFYLRRIEGMPQRQIADHLGLAEHIVEAQAARGLKLIMKAIAQEEGDAEQHQGMRYDERSAKRRDD